MSGTTVDEVLAELAALEDPGVRAVNERHGDDHGVNLTKLRAVAKRLGTQQDLAQQLWGTGETAARLLGLLICRPKAFGRHELDAVERFGRGQPLILRTRTGTQESVRVPLPLGP